MAFKRSLLVVIMHGDACRGL